jgi:exopolysaccharide biosynthesis polyprenyl glycosylphosphotransferase
MKSNASLLYSLSLVIGDYLAVLAAFAAAFYIRGQLSNVPVAHPIPASTYIGLFLALLPFWILIFGLLGLYSNSIYEKRFAELGRLLIGSFIGLLFVIGYGYAVNRAVFPARLVPVYGFGLAFLFLVVFRNGARMVRSVLFAFNKGITNLLIIGDTRIAQELVDSLADDRVSGYKIIGLVGSKSSTAHRFAHLPTFSTLGEAIKKLKSEDIHSIVQTELYADGIRNNEILDFAQTHHIAYRFVPGNSELFVGNIAVELFRGSIPVIAVHQTSLIGWGRFVKRISDLVFSLILLVIALPFMLVIALLIKSFEPKAEIFYRERRLTRFGEPVRIFKFRSMRKEFSGLTPEEAFSAMGRPELIKTYRNNGDFIANDPRISRIGQLIRRTSLDELPQLFNIIRGDISFVGPRALQVGELDKYDKKDLILAVKSGLTGLAQVSGRRDISFEERRKLDLYYVQNWSLWLDISILIKTIRAVIRGRGAI